MRAKPTSRRERDAAAAATEPLQVDAARETTGASVMRGGAWQALSHVLPQVYTLLISVAAARYLGPELFGRQSFIAFVALSVNWVLTGGLATALLRSVAESLGRGEPGAVRGLVRWAWRVQVVVGLVGGGGLALVGMFDADLASAWILAGIGTLMGILFSVPSSLLLGAQRFREAAVVGLVGGTVAVPAAIAVLAAGGGITGIFAVEAAIVTVNLAWASLLARGVLRGLGARPAADPELQRTTVRFALATTVTVVLTVIVWRRSEFFFLARYSSAVEIGIYSIAFAAVTALATLPERLGGTITSAFATLVGAGATQRIRSGYGRAMRLLILLSLPMTAATAALGPAAVELVYGREFADVRPVLLVLLLGIPIIPLWNVSGSLLTGMGHARAQLLSGVSAAVANVALAFALVPGHGAVGAALANLGGQVAGGLAMFAFAHRVVGSIVWGTGSLGRCAVASAGSGLAGWAAVTSIGGVAGLALGMAAMAVAFALLAVALRILSTDDAGWLETHLGDRLGGRIGRGVRLVAREPRLVPGA